MQDDVQQSNDRDKRDREKDGQEEARTMKRKSYC